MSLNDKICPLCDSGEPFLEIESDVVYGGKSEQKYIHCKKCDFYYLDPKPTEQELELFYKKHFEDFMSERSGADSNWKNEHEHSKISGREVARRMAHIEPHVLDRDLDILEVGASSGFMLDYMRDRYQSLSLFAVEPSDKFREFLERKGYPSYQGLSRVSAEKKSFDIIIHFFVVAHVYDFKKFVEECLSVLKEGGVMIFETPSATDALYSLYDIPAYKKFYWQVAHIVSFTNKSMKYYLDSLGLRYEIIPEQRYDLSNHMVWMQEGKPGGRYKYSNIFNDKLEEEYKNSLKNSWKCDSMFVKIYK